VELGVMSSTAWPISEWASAKTVRGGEAERTCGSDGSMPGPASRPSVPQVCKIVMFGKLPTKSEGQETAVTGHGIGSAV
jgi:hypothetical protein